MFKWKYDVYSMKEIIFLIPDPLGLINVGVSNHLVIIENRVLFSTALT